MNKELENRVLRLERQAGQGEPVAIDLDALPEEARADFLAHYSEGGMDVKSLQSETLRALLEQCDAATKQPSCDI